MKRIIRAALCLLLSVSCLLACSCGGSSDDGDATKLSFKSASSYAYLSGLNGKTVTISGYMATSSPTNGSFIFLMNLPYQSCPFCKPNTSELSNTMEVYPKAGRTFDYTNQAIKVTGKLVVSEDVNKPFTDLFGYQFNFKIVDADYRILSAKDLSDNVALWQKIAETDVISDIYAMYDYVNFLCAWNTYFVNSTTDAKGNVTSPGYYLYAADAVNYVTQKGAQFNYGYQSGYFDGIVKKIERVDKTAFADLVANVRRAEDLASRALSDLENGKYTYVHQYVEKFGTEDDIYTLDNGDAFVSELDAVYQEFADWLGSWEM